MKLFGKGKSNTELPTGSNIIAEKLNGFYEKLQVGWVQWMDRHTASLTKRDWALRLFCFVLCMGSYSAYRLINGVNGTKQKLFTITEIHKPISPGRTGTGLKDKAIISEAEHGRILRFHHYMDSLSADPSGKRIYDSIKQYRPGLMDSIRQIEDYYQQLKDK